MKDFKIFILFIGLIIHPLCAEAQMVNRVVAVVNEEVITQQDMDQLLAVLYAQYVQEYKGDELLAKMEEVKKDLLNQMVDDRLILSRAKELGANVREGEINEKLEAIKDGFSSEKEFYDTLETQGITVSDLKNRYRDQLLMKKIMDFEVQSKVSVLPSEISGYYETHREGFKQGEKHNVRHILIKARDEVGFELAKVEIDNVYNKLKEGYAFDELAKEYSQGSNKDQGGNIGYVERGEMLEELDDVIFSLKPGEFSAPVKTGLGYHIVKVEEAMHAGYLSLDDVRMDIKRLLFQKKVKERLSEWLDELRREAYISIK